jgi:hypothetical protein
MNSDEEFGRYLPALLTEAPMPPSTVDVGQAIRTGRRRRQSRYVGSAIPALAVIMAVPIALQSQRPQAPPLAVPSTSPSAVVAKPTVCSVAEVAAGFLTFNGDPSGRHFAGILEDLSVDGAQHKPAMWRNGKIEMIPVPADSSGYVDAVNASGVVMGRLVNKEGVSAFVYQDGKLHVLLDSKDSKPIAINDAGVVVGTRRSADNWVPIRWLSASSAPEALSLPASHVGGVAVTVTDDGVVYGTISPNAEGSHMSAYMWTADGEGSPLIVPTGSGQGIITGRGEWVGGMLPPKDQNSKHSVFVFNTRTLELRQSPNFFLEGETPVTSNGWFIGRALGAQDRWMLTDGTTAVELPLPQGITRVVLDSVSADGRVVTGHRVGEARAGVIWRCG